MTSHVWSLPRARSLAAVACVLLAVAGCGGKGKGSKGSLASGQQTTPAQAATGLQAQFVRVVRDASPSVVLIESSGGLGSGVVFDDRGNIVTNAHVVGNAKRFKVTLVRAGPTTRRSSGPSRPATSPSSG